MVVEKVETESQKNKKPNDSGLIRLDSKTSTFKQTLDFKKESSKLK